jgi:hypothetical protein
MRVESVELLEPVSVENCGPEAPAIPEGLQAEVDDFIERLVLERDAILFEG